MNRRRLVAIVPFLAAASSSLIDSRNRRFPRSVLVALLAAVAGTSAGGAADRLTEPRVAALWKREIHFFDERATAHLGSLELPRGWAQSWWLDPARARLGVVSREGLLKQKGPLQLSVVDLVARRLVASEAIDGTLQFQVQVPSGETGFVALLGEEAKRGRSAAPPRLVRIDLGVPAGRVVTATRDLSASPTSMGLSRDERELVLVFAGASGKARSDRRPGRVEILSAESLEPRGTLELPGPVGGIFWNGDRSRLYLEDPGIDSARPEAALSGRLYVLDPAAATLVADLELGIGPGPLSWDPVRGVSYILTRPIKAKEAATSLRVLRGDAFESEIGLPSRPVAVFPSADRSRLFLLEERGLAVFDSALGAVEGRIALPDRPTGLLEVPGRNRAFVSFAGSERVVAVDLAERRQLAAFTTGRTSKKIGLAAAAALATGLSSVQSMMLFGDPYSMAQVVTVPTPETSGFLAPDERLAFFYNSQTADYTIVDVESSRMVDQVAGAGLRFLPDGKRAAMMQVTDVALWDLEQRRPIVEIDAGGGGKFLCPDGDHVWALAGIRSLNVVDLERRTVVRKFDELGGSLLFYDATPPAAPAPDPQPPEP